MKKLAIWTILGLVSGILLGDGIGVTAFGSGWNGAWFLGPIGALIGFLIALKLPIQYRKKG